MKAVAAELLKIAREMTAGVSVGIEGFHPMDLWAITYKLQDALGQKYRSGEVKVEIDGGESSEFVGTINIYLYGDSAGGKVRQVMQEAASVMKDLKGVHGRVFANTSKMFGVPTVRVEIKSNEDESLSDMVSSHLSYSTWGRVLEGLGFSHEEEDVMGGAMPMRDFVDAYRKHHGELTDPRVQAFARQIAGTMEAGLKQGYKDMSWG